MNTPIDGDCARTTKPILESQLAILRAVDEPMTNDEIIEQVDFSSSTVHRHLPRLVDRGLLEVRKEAPVANPRAAKNIYTRTIDAVLIEL